MIDASLLEKAYIEIKRLKQAVLQSGRESLAIVGMSCRFPGASDLDALWQLLMDKKHPVTEMGGKRGFSEKIGAGGDFACLVDNVELFDAAFFRISPVEARGMDPQQRLALECAWEAIENAGYNPESLSGTKTGVYLGAANSDYSRMQFANHDGINEYAGTGGSQSIIPNRISFVLNLQGPSIAVDTACSSSLVAVDMAVKALASRDIDMALVGGVSLILSPELSLTFSRAEMLAEDGRCKTFDASADGYVRGEGAGIVLVKRLRDAIADGDHIWAEISGSAVGQDGTTNGLTAPNGKAQELVINQALVRAGLTLNDVAFVEAHGTGTPLGDPIEMGALKATYGSVPRSCPLHVGTIKTNIGHLEAAAGIAGLIKSALCLHYKMFPASLHFETPSPYIQWDDRIKVVKDAVSLVPEDKALNGAVSSFGFGGTNAHVILSSAPEMSAATTEPEHFVLKVSAASSQGFRQIAENLKQEIQKRRWPLGDLVHTWNTGRGDFAYREIVTGNSREALIKGLENLPVPEEIDPENVGALVYWEREGQKFDGVKFGIIPEEIARSHADLRHLHQLGYRHLLAWEEVDAPWIIHDLNMGEDRLLSKIYHSGGRIQWDCLSKGHRVPLPTTPFQRKAYWWTDALQDRSPTSSSSEIISELMELKGKARRTALIRFIQKQIAEVLGSEKADIGEHARFFDLGLDSLRAMDVKNALEKALGKTLSVTLAIDYPTVSRLADHLLQDVLGLAKQQQVQKRYLRAVSREKVAIVGMACRFPGGANNLESYWELLSAGRDAVTEMPETRRALGHWPSSEQAKKMGLYVDKGAFLGCPVEAFDPLFFGISPREAKSMDPQHRLALEVVWEAMEDAGIPREQAAGLVAGVFMGINTNDYLQLMLGSSEFQGASATGTTFSTLSGRLSYFFDFKGPSLSIDTACSSSLVALHLACQSLLRGETDLGIAGGVSLILSPATNLSLCHLEALSKDGRCKTFDERADGYGRGEGAGVLVLKRLSDAEAAEDRIWAVVSGSCVNQDGASGGLTVPNGPSQEAVIQGALDSAGLEAKDISYVEAHGTGTELGDPIEITALAHVLCKGRKEPLQVGSVKTNIGHLEAAAGIAGLIKIVLSIQQKTLPPHVHMRSASPHIPWERYPINIPQSLKAWQPSDNKLRAGLSSFGFSGTNAHVIIEGVEGISLSPSPASSHLLVLSAPTEERLEALIESYLSIENPGTMADLSYTLGACRTHFPARRAYVVSSWEEFKIALGKSPATSAGEEISSLAISLKGEGLDLDVTFAEHCSLYGDTLDVVLLRMQSVKGLPTKEELLAKGPLQSPLGQFLRLYVLAIVWTKAMPAVTYVPGDAIGQVTHDVLLDKVSLEKAASNLQTGDVPTEDFQGEIIKIEKYTTHARFLMEIGRVWQRGVDVHFSALDTRSSRLKLRLPGQVYLKQPYWFEDLEKSRWQQISSDWFYEVIWQEHPLETGDRPDFELTEQQIQEIPGDRVVFFALPSAKSTDWRDQLVPLLKLIQETSKKLWIVTTAVHRIHGEESDLSGAVVHGFARGISLEYPENWGGIIDLPPGPTKDDLQIAALEINAATDEDSIAYRKGRRYVQRLSRCQDLPQEIHSAQFDADASYLITGGLGALGLKTAIWMAEQGVRHFVLTSRSGKGDEALLETLSKTGATYAVVAVDVADQAGMKEVFKGFGSTYPPLRGIVHAAGALPASYIRDMTEDDLTVTLKPKVEGTWILHELSQSHDIDLFLCYSSCVTAWGSVMAAHYSAANYFQDACTRYRLGQNLPAQVIRWGWWQDGGLVEEGAAEYFEKIGLNSMAGKSAFLALGHVLGSGITEATVASVDWTLYKPVFEVYKKRPFLERIEVGPANGSLEKLTLTVGKEKEELCLFVLAAVKELLQLPGTVEEDKGFFDMGMDSIMAAELQRTLSDALGLSLEPTIAFEHPTVGQLSQHLLQEMGLSEEQSSSVDSLLSEIEEELRDDR